MMSSAPSSSSPLVAPPLYPGQARKFAPLDPESAKRNEGSATPGKLRGVIFDVDGTLCLPQNYMFREMRAALEISPSTDILSHIRSLPTRPARASAVRAIQTIERRAMTQQRPQPGLLELMQYLDSRGIRKGLCTRNFPAPVDHLREKFLPGIEFEGVVTRDTAGIRAKPEGDGLWMIVEGWNNRDDPETSNSNTTSNQGNSLPNHTSTDAKGPITNIIDEATTDATDIASFSAPDRTSTPPAPNNPYTTLPPSQILHLRHTLSSNIIMVGDSIDDMLAGRNAGAATVLLVNDENKHLLEHEATDLGIASLLELRAVLEGGFVGRVRG